MVAELWQQEFERLELELKVPEEVALSLCYAWFVVPVGSSVPEVN